LTIQPIIGIWNVNPWNGKERADSNRAKEVRIEEERLGIFQKSSMAYSNCKEGNYEEIQGFFK